MIKLIAGSLLIGSSVFFTSIVGAGAYLATGGVALCRVETPEIDLTIPVPTRLVDMGIFVARIAVPRHELDEVRREVEPFLPIVDALVDEISRLPDGTVLVSVDTPAETVLVQRRGGRFHVDVEAADATVHVSLPARSLRRIGGEIRYLF